MKRNPSRSSVSSRLLLAAALSCALPGTVSASTRGPGGVAFWGTEVNDSWFNPFRWGGILPWQGGVPVSDVSCRIELAVQVDVLGQGQFASCHHLQFNNTGIVVRVAGSSTRAELNVHGTQMDNNGLILIGGQDALHDSSLIIHNNTNANGANGRIRLSAPLNRSADLRASSNQSWLLVNWPAHTIEGNGNIQVRLQNDGLIDANVNGRELIFDGSHAITNAGIVRARNGGVLRIAGSQSVFEQTGGGETVVEAGSGLSLVGCSNQGFRGGKISGAGQVIIGCQGMPMENVELMPGLNVGFAGNSGLLVGPGGITNQTLIRTGANGFITSRQNQSGELRGAGRVQLEGGILANLFGGGGQAMVNSAGHTLGGVGTIALALTNRGTVSADRNSQTSGPGELLFQTSNQGNEGVIVARDGGTIRLLEITLNQTNDGQLRALDGSAVVLQGSTSPARVVGGSILTSGSGVVVASGSNDILESLRIEAGSQVLAPCVRTLKLVGTIDNRGRITVDNNGCGPNFATLRGESGAALTGAGEVRLLANGDGANATLEGVAALSLGTAQVLTGSGRINGAVRLDGVLMPDQTFAPVNPVGKLTVNAGSTLTLTSSARFMVDIRSPSSFDRIDGSGNVAVRGRLIINLLDSFVLTQGASFDIVTGNTVTGSFDSVEFPPGFESLDATIERLPDRLRLVITGPLFRNGFEAN